MVGTFFAVTCGNLTTKEKIFMAFAWLPKATVQAALGEFNGYTIYMDIMPGYRKHQFCLLIWTSFVDPLKDEGMG